MRNFFIVAVVVIGSATITGDAQGAAKSQRGLPPPISKVTAARVVHSKPDGDALFSGGVTISIPGATITADSALYHHDSKTIDLTGHVTMKVAEAK